MKTINQGSIDFLKSGKGRDTCGGYLPNRWFEAGVEFAQKWNLIERDQYALIDSIQKEELVENMPIIVSFQDGNEIIYDVFAEYSSLLEDPLYTHWRPINYK